MLCSCGALTTSEGRTCKSCDRISTVLPQLHMLSTGSAGKDNDVSAKQKLQKAALSIGGNEIKKCSWEVIILMTETQEEKCPP